MEEVDRYPEAVLRTITKVSILHLPWHVKRKMAAI